jgi:thioredoxin reductase (NADPH)
MHDVVIIGAGPAGLSAALYAGRFRLNAVVLEKMSPGGQIVISSTIDNYPGFPGGLATQDLIDKFIKQVEDVGVKIQSEEVLEIEKSFKLKTPHYNIRTSERSYETKCIIIATGAQSKRLGAQGEEELIGRGVSYCATCDGPLFKNKEVVVVGGGDRAIEEALFLTSYAKKVTIVHRRKELRASKILVEKARINPKISFVLDSVLEKISGVDRVEDITVKDVLSETQSYISCQGVFIFVGIIPDTKFLKGLIQLDDAGFIVTDQELKTSSEGVFACGDCRKKSLYQVITACAEGATAADCVHKYLLNL